MLQNKPIWKHLSDVYFFVIPPNVIKIKINHMDYIFLDNQKLNTEFAGFSVDPFSVSFFSTLGDESLDHKVLTACCSSLSRYLSLPLSQLP